MSNNATKINDYNTFLSLLDKKKTNFSNSNKSSNLKEVIKSIENNYNENKYNSINFSGWGTFDVIKSKIKISNPDEYIDFFYNDTIFQKKDDLEKIEKKDNLEKIENKKNPLIILSGFFLFNLAIHKSKPFI